MKTIVWIVILAVVSTGSRFNPSYGATGKFLFKQKCVSCHQSKGVTPPVEPVDKASFQWQYFFKRNKHKRRYQVDLGSVLTQREIELIETYLVNHGSDSDYPEMIGKR